MRMVLLLLVMLIGGTWIEASGESRSDNWFHYEQGMRDLKVRDYDQAQREFNYYLNHPEMHRHMFGVAHFGKGLMFQAMGKYDIAITEFRMAIENDLHPEIKVSDNAYMNIGAIYMKLKAYQDAVQAYSKCVQSNPRNGLAHYYLGMSYLRAGDYENAEKEEEAAKKLGVAFTALSEELTKVKSGTQEETDKKEQSMEKKPKKTSKKKAEAQ